MLFSFFVVHGNPAQPIKQCVNRKSQTGVNVSEIREVYKAHLFPKPTLRQHMAVITAKGHEFDVVLVKDSFSRRAVQFRNNIIQTFKKIGLTEDHVDIPLEPCAFKKIAASITWYFDGHRMYYCYDLSDKFVDNLNVISKVIELEIDALLTERKPVEDFVRDFSEEDDVEEQRKDARIALGLDTDVKDLNVINQRYKTLAREHHPDTPTGNLEKFKAINHAHKILKRELE